MEETWLQFLASTIPQFAAAVVFFWLCQKNADSQRKAYQEQIAKLYDMLSQMLVSVSRSLDLLENREGDKSM